MAIRKYKPTTPGRRASSVSEFDEITRSTPEKSLLRPLSKTGGRNNYGRITTRHIGGGHPPPPFTVGSCVSVSRPSARSSRGSDRRR